MFTEMIRLKIVEAEGEFGIVRKVRKDWLPVLDEKGKPVKAKTRDEAVLLLDKYSRQ